MKSENLKKMYTYYYKKLYEECMKMDHYSISINIKTIRVREGYVRNTIQCKI